MFNKVISKREGGRLEGRRRKRLRETKLLKKKEAVLHIHISAVLFTFTSKILSFP